MKCYKINDTFSAACFQDFRHWSADPNAVKQAFYEWNQQPDTNNSLLKSHHELYESLCNNQEIIIQRFKERLKPLISCQDLNALLDVNSCDNPCYNNTSSRTCDDTIHCHQNTFSYKEFYESLLNDRNTIINRLVNCLKGYECHNEVNKLLDVNECEQIVTYDYQELEYVFECVFGLMKKITAYIIPFDFKFKSKTDQVNQIECYDFCGDQPTTCFEDCQIPSENEYNDYNQTICTCNSQGDSISTNSNKCKGQSLSNKRIDDENPCEESTTDITTNTKFIELVSLQIYELQKKKFDSCVLLMEMRKANMMIKK